MGTGHPPPHSNHQCRQAIVCKRQPTGQIQPPPVSAQVFLRTRSSNTPPVAASQWRRRAAWLFQHEHHRAAISRAPALPGEGRPAPLGGGCRRNVAQTPGDLWGHVPRQPTVAHLVLPHTAQTPARTPGYPRGRKVILSGLCCLERRFRSSATSCHPGKVPISVLSA